MSERSHEDFDRAAIGAFKALNQILRGYREKISVESAAYLKARLYQEILIAMAGSPFNQHAASLALTNAVEIGTSKTLTSEERKTLAEACVKAVLMGVTLYGRESETTSGRADD